MKTFFIWLMAIILYICLFCLSALMVWGVGLLFIEIFTIDFVFTYPMALVITLIITIIGGYFKG